MMTLTEAKTVLNWTAVIFSTSGRISALYQPQTLSYNMNQGASSRGQRLKCFEYNRKERWTLDLCRIIYITSGSSFRCKMLVLASAIKPSCDEYSPQRAPTSHTHFTHLLQYNNNQWKLWTNIIAGYRRPSLSSRVNALLKALFIPALFSRMSSVLFSALQTRVYCCCTGASYPHQPGSVRKELQVFLWQLAQML